MGTSLAEGYLVVPVWSDSGEIKPVIDNDGKIPVTLSGITGTVNVNLESSDITLPVSLSGIPTVLEVEIVGQLIDIDVNLKSSDITLPVNLTSSSITLPVSVQNFPTTIESRTEGYINGNYQKLPFLFGISDVYSELETLTVTVAGTNILTFSDVPTGEIWVITSMHTRCTTNNPLTALFQIVTASGTMVIHREIPTLFTTGVNWSGMVYLKAADNIKITLTSCNIGDKLDGYVIGYKMDVDL